MNRFLEKRTTMDHLVGSTLGELEQAVEVAQHVYAEAQAAAHEATRALGEATSRLTQIQRSFDTHVADLISRAPKESPWGQKLLAEREGDIAVRRMMTDEPKRLGAA